MTKKQATTMMNEAKKQICGMFKKNYGFAPAMSAIWPMETGDNGIEIQFMAFVVGGIGYSWDGITLERNDAYDL